MSDDELKAIVLRAISDIAPEADLAHLDPTVDVREQLDIDSMDSLNIMIGIHEATGGHPRQVTMLCHRALKTLLFKNKLVVDSQVIEELIQEDVKTGWQRTSPLLQKSSY